MLLNLSQCTVRLWRESDDQPIAHHANNRNVWLNVHDHFPYPYSLSDARQWIKNANAASPITHFAIEVDGQAAGAIGFKVRQGVYRRSAEMGYWLGEAVWGRGIATEALRAVTEHAFANFDLCRIYACVFNGTRPPCASCRKPVTPWKLASKRMSRKTDERSMNSSMPGCATIDRKPT